MPKNLKTAGWFTVVAMAVAWISLGGIWVDDFAGVTGRVEKSQNITLGGRQVQINVSAQVHNRRYFNNRPLLISSAGSKFPADASVALNSDQSDSFASVSLLEGSLTLDGERQAEAIEGCILKRVVIPEASIDYWHATITLPLTRPSNGNLTLTFRVEHEDGEVQVIPLAVPIAKLESATRIKPGWTGFVESLME